MQNRSERITVEELAADCIDVRELQRRGLLNERTVTLRPLLRWPVIATLRADRYVIELNFCSALTQYVHLSWTPCTFGSYRPWMLCPHCRKRVARLYKGMGGYFCRACPMKANYGTIWRGSIYGRTDRVNASAADVQWTNLIRDVPHVAKDL